MRFPLPSSRRPSLQLGPGERLLAWAAITAPPSEGPDFVGGSRDALYLPTGRIPWEHVASAEWSQEETSLRVVEVGRFGEPSPVHVVGIEDAPRFLELLRERVSASIVVQRHVTIADRKAVRILARQAPGHRSQRSWFVEYDDGLDPADPHVDALVQDALALARSDLGE